MSTVGRPVNAFVPQGWGGGVLRVSSDGDDRMQENIEVKKFLDMGLPTDPHKNPGPTINPPKNPMPNFQALPRIFRLFSNCCIARDITAAMLVVKNKSISLLSGNLHCDWENREHLKHLRNVIVLQEKSQSGARKLNPRRCTSSDKRPMGMCRWMGSYLRLAKVPGCLYCRWEVKNGSQTKNTPQNSLKLSHSPNFPFSPPPPKKKTGIENFKPKKVLRSSQALEIWSTPPGVLTCVQMFKL